jgi:ankyrin repeat protein
MNPADSQKLRQASRVGDVKVIRQLLPQLDARQPADQACLDQALAQAVHGRAMEAVDLLLKAGGNPDQATSIGTLLSGAAMNGDLPLVKRLIEAGADSNREIKRETALSAALSENQTAVVDYLESLGAHSPPVTTLFYASQNGDVARAKKALAAGAEAGQTSGPFGQTPLMAAARKGHAEIVKLLLDHGANPNQRLKESCALFDAVASERGLAVFELLVAAGADVLAKHYDETLLMAAARGGGLAIVQRLVELGADVNARDKNFNLTALDLAKTAKHQDVVDYLDGLGAKSDRTAGRALIQALARKYGGKPVEHSHGFLLNSEFGGYKCQFHAYTGTAAVVVNGLNYADAELKRAEMPGLVFGGDVISPDQPAHRVKKAEVKSAGRLLGIPVRRADGEKTIPEDFILGFCKQHEDFFRQLALSGGEQLGIASKGVRFFWTEADPKPVLPRLKLLEDFLQEISRPALPERRLFEKEWLLKPVPKTGASKPAHALGGALAKPVACPHCGLPTNRMAQIDLSDPLLSKTPMGSGRLPVFWCLSCLEWDAAFFDVSRPVPKAIIAAAGTAKAAVGQTGEEDLPERRVTLVPVPAGRKAGRKSKIGGSPGWIQSEATPSCPKCKKPMAFVLQLAGDAKISYSDQGLLYAFACPECHVTASLIQSH